MPISKDVVLPSVGDRVALIDCADAYATIDPGTHGTVTLIGSLGTVHVAWDDGTTLGLVPGWDTWEQVEDEQR